MKKKFETVFRLAMPYVITMLLPIIAMFCLSSILVKSYEQRVVADKQKNIQAAFERYLQKIEAVENLSYVIEKNEVLTNYIYTGFTKIGRDPIECMDIKELLNDFLVNDDVTAIYFYDARDDLIIAASGVYSNSQTYFRYKYQLREYTPENAVERLKNYSWGYGYSIGMEAVIDGKSTNVMEYRISVPINKFGSNQPQLVMVMELDDIFSDFYDLMEPGYEFYVYDHENQLIWGNGEEYEQLLDVETVSDLIPTKQEDQVIYGMVCHSPEGFWKLKVCMPSLLNAEHTRGVTPYIWLLVVVTVVISVLLCMYFTYKNHKEIQEIQALFKKQNAAISKYECSRKYEILDKLVRNTYKNKEDLALALGEIDLKIGFGSCVVLCMRFDDSSYRACVTDNITVKDFVKELLANIIEVKFEIFDTSAKETICLLSMDEQENAEVVIRDIVSRMNVEIAYHYDIDITIAVGNIVESVHDIHTSYTQAQQILQYSEASGNKLYLYSELEKQQDIYFYPRQTDEKIYNYVVVGQAEEAKRIIQKIYKENFENDSRYLSPAAIETIKSRIKKAVLVMVEKYSIPVEKEVCQLEGNIDNQEFFETLLRMVDVITAEIEDKRQGTQKYSAVKIMNYIKEHYCDSELSVKQISCVLGYHEKYISNLFKETYHECLSAVIERLRIEKACDLLKNSNGKITDITEAVGYTSDVSFRRAFKKITGVSPSEYRERI